MSVAASTETVAEVVLVTDPLADDESGRIVQGLAGWRRAEGSPIKDGTPYHSRSVFALSNHDLVAGGLEARIDLLAAYGIAVHRVVGDHPAVGRANRRLGYV